MPRPRLPYFRAFLKVSLPAELLAEVQLLLEDPLTKKPRYGAQAKLIEALLRNWLAENRGDAPLPIPTLTDLRSN